MSTSGQYPDAARHQVIFRSSSNSSSSSNSVHDEWNLPVFDSVERNRSRRQLATAKRAQSFTIAYEQTGQNFGHRSSATSGSRQRSSSTSGHLYVKAMNFSQGLPHYQRQSYQDPANQARMLSARNEYSTGQQRSPASWQDASQQGHAYIENNRTMDNNQFPNKLSYSDLSQDSAYHSRHSSSLVDMVGDPSTTGQYSYSNAKSQVHGRFPSWSETDKPPVDSATHLDEVVSPRAARRIFEEASARNARSTKLKNRPPSQNYANFQSGYGRPDNVDGGSRYDATPVQPQRTKSFSGLTSMTQSTSPSAQYKSSGDLSQLGGAGFRSGGGAANSHHFYNMNAQTETSRRETEGGRVNQEWLNPDSGGRPGEREWTTAKPHPNVVAADDRFLTRVQEASPPEMDCGSDDRLNRNLGSSRHPDGDAVPPKGYPLNQPSVIRQLSKELYGVAGKRGVGLTSRMIVTGERPQRLGAIGENTPINDISGYEGRPAPNPRRKSSEFDRSSKGMDGGDSNWRGSSLPQGVSGGNVNNFPDRNENPSYVTEEDLGDGSGFVRNRKCQASLRKAFGIYNEFEIMENSPKGIPPPRQMTQSIRNTSDLEHRGDFEALRGSKSSLAPSDALRNHNPDDHSWQQSPDERVFRHASDARVSPQSSTNPPHLQRNYPEEVSFGSSPGNRFETSWQGNQVDVDTSQGHPSAHSTSFPGSDLSRSIARRKSESLPRQQTPLQLSDNAGRRLSSHDPGTSVLYTGTGVLSVNLVPSLREDPQRMTEVRELDRTKPSTSSSSSSLLYGNSPRNSTGATSPLPIFDSNTSPNSSIEPRSASSPSPPELPPRQYRKPDFPENDQIPVKDGTAELFSSNDSDVDSTLKRDTYAQQLRHESRRLSHSHSSSHAIRRQSTMPTSSNWKAGNESFNLQTEGRYEGEVGVAPMLSERLTHSFSVPSHLPLDGEMGESGEMERMMIESGDVASDYCGQNVDPSYRSVRNLSSKFSSGAAFEKSYACEPTVATPTEVNARLQSPARSPRPIVRSSRSANRFQEESEEGGNPLSDHHWRSPTTEATIGFPTSTSPYSISSETSVVDVRNRSENQMFGSVQGSPDNTEADSKRKHRHKVGIHKTGKPKEKIDTAIVLPSVRSVESVPERDATPPVASERTGKTHGKVAKVKCLPREWKSTEESTTYDCALSSVDAQHVPDDDAQHPPEASSSRRSHPATSSTRRSRHKQKHLQKSSSTYDDPASVIADRLPNDERTPETSNVYECPASVAIQHLPHDEKKYTPSKETAYNNTASTSVIVPRLENLPHPSARNQPSSVAIQRLPNVDNHPSEASSEYNRPPSTSVIQRNPKDERRSSGRFSSPLHKTAADYMTGLFTEEEEENGSSSSSSAVQQDTLTRNSVQRASLRNRLLVARQAKENKEKVGSAILPEETNASLSDELREIPLVVKSSGEDIHATTEEEKLELVRVLEKKVEILQEEKQLLNEEIAENKIFGRQVTAIVEQRLEAKELSKYRSYVDELEKVLYLVLKLSDRLANAENAILSLPQNASDKEKAALVAKRNDLAEKHGDALSLKEGIDRRRHQVSGYLQKCLSEAELKDYEYFVKMKAQLVIDQQEVEDKIEMGQRQLDLLRSTLNSDLEFLGPKSYC